MQRAIVAVSFGVGDSCVKARCIDPLLADLRRAFGGHGAEYAGAWPENDGNDSGFAVVEAWTSNFLRKKMAGAGHEYMDLAGALTRLSAAGCHEVVIMPTHLTPGEEFQQKILPVARDFAGVFDCLSLMEPVFTAKKPDDFAFLTAEVLGLADLAPGEAMVFMGHGSPHQHNPAYELLQQYADGQGWPVYIGVVEQEDFPGFEHVLHRLNSCGAKRVYLRPLLLAGGSHATEDLAGEGTGSWKSRLLAAGFSLRCSIRGLGEYAAFRNIYIEKLRCVINKQQDYNLKL